MKKQNFYLMLIVLVSFKFLHSSSKLPFGTSSNTVQVAPVAQPAPTSLPKAGQGATSQIPNIVNQATNGPITFCPYDYNKAAKFFALSDMLLYGNPAMPNVPISGIFIKGSDGSFLQNVTGQNLSRSDVGSAMFVLAYMLSVAAPNPAALTPQIVISCLEKFFDGFTDQTNSLYQHIQSNIGSYGSTNPLVNSSYMQNLLGQVFASMLDMIYEMEKTGTPIYDNYLCMIATKIILDYQNYYNTTGIVNQPLTYYYVFNPNSGNFSLNQNFEGNFSFPNVPAAITTAVQAAVNQFQSAQTAKW